MSGVAGGCQTRRDSVGRRLRTTSVTWFGLAGACFCLSRPAQANEDAWWARDKALHFLTSGSIAGATYAAGTLQWDSRVPTICLALGVAIAAGAGKEGWDAMGHGDASWKDFTWDVIGAIAGVGLSFAVDTAVRPANQSP